jgi:hypothetical protein
LQEIAQISAAEMIAEARRLREDYARIGKTSPTRSFDAKAGSPPLQADRGYQLYLALGRFRNALVLDEAARHLSPGMSALISAYGLEAYQTADTSARAAQR